MKYHGIRKGHTMKFNIINNIIVSIFITLAIIAKSLDLISTYDLGFSVLIACIIYLVSKLIYKYLFKKKLYLVKKNTLTRTIAVIYTMIANVSVVVTREWYIAATLLVIVIVLEAIYWSICFKKEKADT